MARRKRKYGGPKYGLSKEKTQAPKEIRKRYSKKNFIIKRSKGSKGASDFKVFRKLKDGSQGACVAAIQVKSSARAKGARYSPYDATRLRMSASHHSPRCKPWFLLLERGKAIWEAV